MDSVCIPPWGYAVILVALVLSVINTLNTIRKRTKKVADGPECEICRRAGVAESKAEGKVE